MWLVAEESVWYALEAFIFHQSSANASCRQRRILLVGAALSDRSKERHQWVTLPTPSGASILVTKDHYRIVEGISWVNNHPRYLKLESGWIL
jgi:hypothetical protein